jgi:dipeptidase
VSWILCTTVSPLQIQLEAGLSSDALRKIEHCFKQTSYDPPRRLNRSVHMRLHQCRPRSLRRQTLRHIVKIKLRMPLSHPSKSEIGPRNQI